MTIRLFLMLEALMALGATTVFAAKPLDPDHNVVAMSNGFPMPTRALRRLGVHSRISK